jgi:hypothetical protein
MFSGVSIPHRDSFLSTPLPRPGDSREGLLSALKVVIRKKAKQGGPFSFEIENTETRRTRNQVDPGILQQGFPLIRRVTAWNERARWAKVAKKRKLKDVRRVALSAVTQVESVPHHYDVLGKRLVLDSTDRENHSLSRFETVAIHNVRQNEGKLAAVRAINNSKPLRVNFLDDSYHFVSSPRARLFSFSIFLGHRLSKELPYSLFFPACSPESDQGDKREGAFAFALSFQL